jgi:hypothetical protein
MVEHHLSKAREVLITLPGQIGERDDGGTTLPYAVCLPPASCCYAIKLYAER